LLRLQVKALNEKMSCYSIAQREAAFSKGSPVGTRSLFNCMGIVIYNRVGGCGVVAHVEARGQEDYAQVVDTVLQKLMYAMNTGGGDKGSLSVVLMGNAGGGDEKFCASVEASLYKHVGAKARLNKFGILDLRNSTARGRIGATTTDLGGAYGGCILDPAHEVLWVDATCVNIVSTKEVPGDVEYLVIQ
jgi:hypothetical protein